MDLIYGVMRAKIIDKAQYCDLWSEGLYPIDPSFGLEIHYFALLSFFEPRLVFVFS